MKGILRRRPSPAMVVAMVALFAALTGTAAALRGHNRVRSDDIKNGQVKTRDLHDGAVTSPKTNVVKNGDKEAVVQTSSTTPVNLGGPSVRVRVGRGAM